MAAADENLRLGEFREMFPNVITQDIVEADQCLENNTKPNWANLSYLYKVIDMLEPSQRLSIVMHRDLIREHIRADTKLDASQQEILTYKATLLVLQDAFDHNLPQLHGDYARCDSQCDYAKYTDQEYVDSMTQYLTDALNRQHAAAVEM